LQSKSLLDEALLLLGKEQGNTMSTEINLEMVDLDPAASAFLSAYIEAKFKIKEWQEKADIAAEQVKAALGEHEVGLVNGREAVRWTTVESSRIDTKKVRDLLPQNIIDRLETKTVSRRFTIVDIDE
jgi:predicted phage-related endonuclease